MLMNAAMLLTRADFTTQSSGARLPNKTVKPPCTEKALAGGRITAASGM